jgi:FKBP-type peptidyl-prolyl cis-trans isomerase 2
MKKAFYLFPILFFNCVNSSPEKEMESLRDSLKIEKTKVPENVEVGMLLQTFGPGGVSVVKVLEINEEDVLIDANHPLAGKKLIFDLEVLEIS